MPPCSTATSEPSIGDVDATAPISGPDSRALAHAEGYPAVATLDAGQSVGLEPMLVLISMVTTFRKVARDPDKCFGAVVTLVD
jgi:hypothetical protein